MNSTVISIVNDIAGILTAVGILLVAYATFVRRETQHELAPTAIANALAEFKMSFADFRASLDRELAERKRLFEREQEVCKQECDRRVEAVEVEVRELRTWRHEQPTEWQKFIGRFDEHYVRRTELEPRLKNIEDNVAMLVERLVKGSNV